jgi:hypothetical protein
MATNSVGWILIARIRGCTLSQRARAKGVRQRHKTSSSADSTPCAPRHALGLPGPGFDNNGEALSAQPQAGHAPRVPAKEPAKGQGFADALRFGAAKAAGQ